METAGTRQNLLKPSRNGKRASMACTRCKKAKRKCDISGRPTDSEGCSNCQEKGETCEVRYGEDKRRRRHAPANADLQARLSALEALLERTTSSVSKANHTDTTASNHAISTDNFSSDRIRNHDDTNNHDDEEEDEDEDGDPEANRDNVIKETTETTLEMNNNNDRPPSATDDGQVNIDFASPPSTTPARTTRSPKVGEYHPSPQVDPARASRASDTIHVPSTQISNNNPQESANRHRQPSSGGRCSIRSPQSVSIDHTLHDEDANTIVSRVISRQRRLDAESDDGHSYFGSTSIFHLCSPQERYSSHQESGKEASEALFDLDCLLEPEPVVSHLLHLFWTWQAPHIQVVPRRQFLMHKDLYYAREVAGSTKTHAFFSPCLLYAIMSMAAMISPDRGVKHHSKGHGTVAGDKYFQKAKYLFDKEIGRPCLTTVQTALLLGSRYGALGQHSLGWTFSGIAVRMAVELGLHLDFEKTRYGGQIIQDMLDARCVVFWGCYVQDKLWSAYCGRPSALDDRNITLSFPGIAFGIEKSSCDAEGVLIMAHCEVVRLTTEMSKILSQLYAPRPQSDHSDIQNVAIALHGDLLQWHSELPEDLCWPNKSGLPASPQVFLMHMQFYFTLILLHRPFMNLKKIMNITNEPEPSTFDTNVICTLAATNITKLARDYSFFYGIKQTTSPAIHFIFIAATVHLINYHFAKHEVDKTWFQGCLSSLSEIGVSYPIGVKAVAVLQSLQEQLSKSEVPKQLSDESRESHAADPHPVRHYSQKDTLGNRMMNADAERTAYCSGTTPQHVSPPDLQRRDTLSEPTQLPEVVSPKGVDENAPGLEQFDWSGRQSPIMLPPTVSQMDMEIFNLDPNFNPTGYPSFSEPSAAWSTGNTGDCFGLGGTFVDHENRLGQEDETQQLRALFDQNYGTSFGLNRL